MITENELQATTLSATKKDFYQIWNELLEIAGKLSERWDPTSTNESDPGIVLLKVLSAVGDHLNYNIDKNILEAFMPSAAQEESMRKLCEMMGYSMAYYRSATTEVTIYYSGDDDDWETSTAAGDDTVTHLILPAFTEITNSDQDVVYTTTAAVTFTKEDSLKTVECIEGTLSYCEEDNESIVTLDNIDDNNRYYLPSSQIAENGVFIYNVSDDTLTDKWEQVDNLNTQRLEKKVYKFGYDSREYLPYIEFPSDVSSLIEDGLSIAYITTNGLNGNVSAKTLTSFETPTQWSLDDGETTNSYNTTGVEHTSDEFTCYNASAATNGEDKESLNDAYSNFKKTVGTFDTLVTCRDYINKIYQLTASEIDTTPLVSNSVVSDIRDDINRAVTICTFDGSGIKYVDKSLTELKTQTVEASSISVTDSDGNVIEPANGTLTFTSQQEMIDHFDLMLYPFKTVSGLNTKSEYDASFKYAGETTANSVIDALDDYKTISHAINLPDDDEIMCVKIYMRLNAKITTTNKVNSIEWAVILANIKEAIYENFNCRQLDFSEEVPFDSILDVISDADSNIKNVSLDDPELYTAFLTADGKEYLFATDDNYVTDDEIIDKLTSSERSEYSASGSSFMAEKKAKANEIYNKLALRNVLAGRVELFNYGKDFSSTIAEKKNSNYSLQYPTDEANPIVKLLPSLTIKSPSDFELSEHQVVQFRAPNFSTSVTYPTYVNYYFKHDSTVDEYAKAATFKTLKDFFQENRTVTGNDNSTVTFACDNYGIFMNYRAARSGNNIVSGTAGALLQSYPAICEKIPLDYVDGLTDIATDDINDGDHYFIPSLTVASANGSVTVDASNFDGMVYQILSGLRASATDDESYGETGEYLKVSDSIEDSTSYSNTKVTDKTIPSRYVKLDVEHVFKKAEGDGNFVYYRPLAATTDTTGTYYAYPLTSTTWTLFHKWLQSYDEFYGEYYSGTFEGVGTRNGLYRVYSCTTSNVPGNLIDENYNKYQLLTSWYSTTSPFDYCYVQELHLGATDGAAAAYGSTADGLGVDATYNTLTADCEYQLREDEFLCLNYTESTSTIDDESTSEDTSGTTYTTTSETVNVYYGPGTIIKPNFDLMDSATKAVTSSYAKTSGYDFSADLGSNDQVPGMFSLGSDEQIEIREQVVVYVYDTLNTESNGVNPVYVYFNVNGSADDRLTFLENGKSRILEEGEYFWYTDRNKQTLTYCGEGTEVINHTGQAITKTEDDDVSTEDILTNGISVVPWIKINNLYMAAADKPSNDDRYIQWNEYQYIELVDGDELTSITLSDGGSTTELTKAWVEVSDANYVSGGESASLPALSVTGAKWSARALLEVSMNSDNGQTLTVGDGYDETITAVFKDGNKETFKDVTLKSNYSVSSMSTEIDTTYNLYDENGMLTETVDDFKLKAYDVETLYTNASSTDRDELTLNNMGNNYTNFSFEDYDDTETQGKPYMTFYCATENSSSNETARNYSLFMLYYDTLSANVDDYVYFIANTDTDEYKAEITIFNNYVDDEESWWANYEIDGKRYLRPGVNIVKVGCVADGDGAFGDTSLRIDVYPGADTADTITLSQLDSVVENIDGDDTDLGLNLSLIGYKGASSSSTDKETAQALLAAINELDPDHEFYYNSLVDSSLEIDINEDAGETLATEAVWFDYNNVNNKFVVAEIDSDYIDTGITLARTSSK